jgi:hypothetical protein
MSQMHGGRWGGRLLRSGSIVLLAGMVAGLAGVRGAPAPEPKDPPLGKENSNALLTKHKGTVKVSASTFYSPSWPPGNVIDGNEQTSWFSASGDAAARGTTPWLEIELPAEESVRRVSCMGNRDPNYPRGYSILAGTIEFFEKYRKSLWKEELNGAGPTSDFVFQPRAGIKGVRYIRFTSTRDEGDQNGSQDVALGEILVE